MIPDYLSGTLSEKEATLFEASLAQKPHLQKEMQELAPLFTNLAQFDYQAMHAQKAQPLTANVLNELAQRKEKIRKRHKSKIPWIQFAVPAVAILLIAILIGQPFTSETMQRNINITAATNEITAQSTQDTLLMIDDVAITQEFFDDYADSYGESISEDGDPLMEIDIETIESALSESIADDIALAYKEIDMPSELIYDAENTLFDECLLIDDELFDENDLEFVLEVMENVTIL
jgi:phosphotransferase system IIA component